MTNLLVRAPARNITLHGIAYGALDNQAQPVDNSHPLPVRHIVGQATSQAISETLTASATVGPFIPELNRAIVLSLSGKWSGSAQLLRSIDAGVTKLPLTLAGDDWASFTDNCNEPVWVESELGASFYLAVTLISGNLTYRVSQ